MSSAKNYEPEFLPGFKEDIDAHPDHKKRAEDKVRLILEHPYHYSHSLTKRKGIDLTGLRASHVGKGKCIILLEVDDDNHKVLFYAFGPHDEVYGAKT